MAKRQKDTMFVRMNKRVESDELSCRMYVGNVSLFRRFLR